jgi:hypothetical protein
LGRKRMKGWKDFKPKLDWQKKDQTQFWFCFVASKKKTFLETD